MTVFLLVPAAGGGMHDRMAATDSEAMSEGMMASLPAYQRLDHVIGRPVRDAEGEKLGRIEDVVLDSRDDSVSYAVLSYGGFFGFRDRLFAVPWSELQTCPETGALMLDVRKEYLKDAPGFAKKHWPDMADEDWAQRIKTFYRQGRQMSAYRESSSGPSMTMTGGQLPIRYRRVTRLIGLSAKDFQGRGLGDLEDVVIDTHSDKVVYGVVILNTTPWALDRELAIVPWTTVEIVPELSALRLDADESMLEAVAFTRGDEFPYLGDPLYAQSVEKRFEGTPYWETLGYVPGDGPMAEETKPGKSSRRVDVSIWRAGSKYNARFDPALVTTVRGTIENIDAFRIGRRSVEGLRFRIKTPEGESRTVHAGPRPFIENQGIMLHFGDEVTVTGAPARRALWRGGFLMATTIRTGGEAFRLRSADGVPEWHADELLGLGSFGR
jgi:sporulation protein YlmC with PRC-barrel domain